MREYSTARRVPAVTSGNLTDDVVVNGTEHPDAVVLSRREPHGPRQPGPTSVSGSGWVDVSARAFLAEVRAVAKGLVAVGLLPGERVGLMSRTRYEWTLLDYAIWFAGAVSVPVYETSSAEQLEWILADSGARAVLTETPEHAHRLTEVRGRLPELHHAWSIEGRGIELLRTLGEDVDDAELEARRTHAGPGDLATIVYTSGTTGRPKGCLLTHGNFMDELGVALEELHQVFSDVPGSPADGQEDGDGPAAASTGSSTLLFLPLAHVFARVVQVGCVRARVRLGHSADLKHLTEDLAGFGPTFVLAVPRVFEKVFNTASQRAVVDGRGRVFDQAVATAIAWSRAQDTGRVGVVLRARHRVYDALVYRRLRAALGGRCRYAVSGGAPLGERLGHFYRGVGLTVLEGYGLTETTAAVCVNLPDALKIGTVGRPLPGASVRVADDGELLFKGDQVFGGYWHDDEATAEVRDPRGWFHTGDVGEIDDEGFVRITGRKKEILVTAGGKNVSPAVLEDRLRSHLLVDQCVVVGDGQPFVAALVTLDPETLPTWAERHGKPGDLARLSADPDLRAEIEAAVEEANGAVSKAESIRRFTVLPGSWTEEGGQLTPSLKLRRAVVLRQHADDIEALYLR
ncbi:MAG: AMP-dependent synthetase and ligase [Marmoricola sp.]|nr:AMP-dependent synthetase and ligase [Marmoricola sp.]